MTSSTYSDQEKHRDFEHEEMTQKLKGEIEFSLSDLEFPSTPLDIGETKKKKKTTLKIRKKDVRRSANKLF